MPTVETNNRSSLLPPLWVLTLLACALLLWLIVTLKEIFVLLILGYAISYLLEPLVLKFTRFKLSRSLSLGLVVTLFILIVVLLASTALPTLESEYERLSEEFPNYLVVAKQKLGPLISKMGIHTDNATMQKFIDSPLTALGQVKSDQFGKLASAALAAILGGYSFTLTILNLFLLPFIVFYISADFPMIHREALKAFPASRRAKVKEIAIRIHGYVSAFISSQLTVCSILTILYCVGLGLVGVELWFLLAVITGFGNLIPYVGTISGIILSSLMALVTFGDWSHLLQVWSVYGVVQLLEGSVITPRIVGHNVGLSPLVVLLALVAAGQLFGLLGLLLAIPMTAVCKVLLGELHAWIIARDIPVEPSTF